MGIRQRTPPKLSMNFTAFIENNYHDPSDPKKRKLCIITSHDSETRVTQYFPLVRAIQLRDKLNELFPPEEDEQ